MVLPSSFLKLQRVLIAPFCLGLCLTLGLIGEGDAASTGSNEGFHLKKIWETDTTQYLFSHEAANPKTAQAICEQNSAKLLSLENEEEFKAISKKLRGFDPSLGDSVWTSGISFSNSTYASLLIWASSNEPFTYSEFYAQHGGNSSTGGLMKSYPKLVNNRRKRGIPAEYKKDCDCDCGSTTPMPPFTVPPCHKPICEVTLPKDPICENISPPSCSIGELPKCELGERKCSLDCGRCYVTKQPNCTIDPNYDPNDRCKLVMPKCEKQDPICKTVGPGTCRAVQDPCSEDDSDACKPIIKPCKNPCTQPECTTIQPPCQKTTCPPSVTACTRPFVDCSPEICQSFVHLCMPPKITCPPTRIICEPPKVHCDVHCPGEPEVICDEPKIICDKPKVECHPAVVHCDTIVSTCEPAKLNCGHPEATGCQAPTINCEESITCPVTPPEEGSGGSCGCGDGSRCRRNSVDDKPIPSEVELVEKTLCVAMKSDYEFKWVLQSCNQHHRFVCEKKQKKDRLWKGFMDNMVIG